MPKKSKSGERQEAVENAAQTIDAEVAVLESLKDELEDTRANLEENFSGTDKYQRLEELVTSLTEAIDQLKEAQNTLEGVNCDYVNG